MSHQCSNCGLFHPAGVACLSCLLPRATSTRSLAAGSLLAGRYRIVRLISQGGASIVYEATDALAPQRRLALKELQPDPEASADDRAEAEGWFARESALLSQLRHPRIPAFYSVFQEDGRSYLSQEYIDGATLDDLVRQQGPLPEHKVAGWGVALCELLIYLHEHVDGAVIFRDLKPANILLRGHDGYLMVVDFGIARRYQPEVRGTVIGTPGYAPPEQYQGLALPASDVYALGATLHRLLTGYDPERAKPFSFPPVRQLNRAVSAPFAALIDRMLALDPSARPASAAVVQDELECLARAAAPPVWSPRSRRLRPGQTFGILAAAFLVAASVLGMSIHTALTPLPSLTGLSTYTLDGVPVGITPGPDGTMWYMNTFIGARKGAIGSIGPTGVVTPYPLDTQPFGIQNITTGPDHTLWIIGGGDAANRIERIDTSGHLLGTYPVPRGTQCYTVLGRSDGTVWLTCNGPRSRHYLERIPLNGVPTSYVLPGSGDVNDIAFGPRGSVWVTQGDQNGGRIWGVSAQGAISSYELAPYEFPFTLATGRDGSIWFTICIQSAGGGLTLTRIGRITPDGRQLVQFSTSLNVSPGMDGPSIKAGSDGNVWFTVPGHALLGRATPAGRITYFGIPGADSAGSVVAYGSPDALMSGPQGFMWVLQAGNPQVLRFDPTQQ